jgi:hypothetical protein
VAEVKFGIEMLGVVCVYPKSRSRTLNGDSAVVVVHRLGYGAGH